MILLSFKIDLLSSYSFSSILAVLDHLSIIASHWICCNHFIGLLIKFCFWVSILVRNFSIDDVPIVYEFMILLKRSQIDEILIFFGIFRPYITHLIFDFICMILESIAHCYRICRFSFLFLGNQTYERKICSFLGIGFRM